MISKVLKTGMLCVLILFASVSVSAKVYTERPHTVETKGIHILGNEDFYPIEYYNSESEKYEGVMTEILKRISKRLGVDFTYINAEKASNAEYAEKLGAEIVSAYITDKNDSYAADEVTVFSYNLNGKTVNVGLAFTDIADEKLINDIKTEISKITESEINGYFVSVAEQKDYKYLNLILLFIMCGVLILIVAVVFCFINCIIKRQRKTIKMTDPETGIGNLLYFVQCF